MDLCRSHYDVDMNQEAAREAVENLAGFFEVLLGWSDEDAEPSEHDAAEQIH